jgi:hypothetical protein
MAMTGIENTALHGSIGGTDTIVEGLENPLPPLPVMIGSAVTVIHYGTDCLMNGRLLGHWLTLELGAPESNIFYGDDLVYIEVSPGLRELGNLYSPMWSYPPNLMNFHLDGLPRLSECCSFHGQDCVVGRYMVNSQRQQKQ